MDQMIGPAAVEGHGPYGSIEGGVGPSGSVRLRGVPAVLLVNPRSGSGRPCADELVAEARGARRRVRTCSAEDDDLDALARAADADALGMAGGDGSLAAVADVALERDLPFVVVPFGTRNHFARDLGLDRDDPIAALDAFATGDERRVDVGRVGDRLFLNNVSLGVYARLVHRRERHRRRRDAFARRARARLILLRDRGDPPVLLVDGEPFEARIVLVGNNAYELDVSRSASASGSTRGCCTCTSRTGCAGDVGGALGTRLHGRRRRRTACGRRSTASPSCSRRRSSSASSRARYGCWCRQASRTSATFVNASSSGGG